MTLRDHITSRIQTEGPMTVADYMATCLMHPTMGYYTRKEAFGTAGDFITAPEISQTFGEMIGLCLAQTWLDQGSPSTFTLAELGPGRGTLMADVLNATRGVAGFHGAAQIMLLEASPKLRAEQTQRIKVPHIHVDDITALPDQPLFLVANEFFDALPIRQFIRDGDHWRERMVGLQDGALSFGAGPAQPQPALDDRLHDTQDGQIVETCSFATPVIDTIGQRIEQNGGAALIIDYGDWRSLGDTLQAVQTHQAVDPLASPGEADLTAHVDFEALTQATPSAFTRITPQGVFLERLGITARAQVLAKSLQGEALDAAIAAHRRLTHPEEMGNLFKVLGLYPSHAAPPPGLEP